MRNRLNAALVTGIAATIAVLSLATLPAGVGGGGTTTLFQFGHFALYFLLAGSLLLYFHDTARGRAEAVLAASVFGLGIELVQLQLPFRTFSAADVAVNALGASLVMLDHRSRTVTRLVEMEDRLIEEYLL